MTTSVLTKNQAKTFGPVAVTGYGAGGQIVARVRYDDKWGNGHNTLSITADITTNRSRRANDIEAGGCLHDEIAQYFPDLAPLIKWHLVSTDGPMYYVANTVYHALQHGPNRAYVYCTDEKSGISKRCVKYCDIAEAEGMVVRNATYSMEIDPKTAKTANLDYARSSARWPEATDEQLMSEDLPKLLAERLPALMAEFRAAVESLGFVY